MTEQDKDILIGKMLDSPSSLTDEELRMIMIDEELKDIYDISSSVKGAIMCQAGIDIDMEREWRLFRHRILPKPSPKRWMMRVAAIILGVVFLSGILVKLTDYIFSKDDKPVVAETESTSKIEPIKSNYADNNPSIDNKCISDTSSEAEEKTSVVVGNTSKTPKLIAEKGDVEEEDIDIDEYLRKQNAEINYEIALLNAEIYLDKQDVILEFMGYMKEDDMSKKDVNIVIE